MNGNHEDPIACDICFKEFASMRALLNHARMEHIDEYEVEFEPFKDDPMHHKFSRQKQKKLIEDEIKAKTEELISSMQPIDLVTLTSNDVEYVIMKAEDEPTPKKLKVNSDQSIKKSKQKKEKTIKMINVKKKREIRTITGPFECMQPATQETSGLCHRIFTTCCEYSAHYRDEHTSRMIRPRCQICERPLPGIDLDALYPCQVCGAGFKTRKELTDHSQTSHINLKPFQCTICQKRFSQRAVLQQHMRTHTGERPYACPHCIKRFTQKSSLEQHVRIHTKDKPYKCVLCVKAFCQSIQLQQHMRTHTNVAPFVCVICSKRFKQKTNLNCHTKNHNRANMNEEQKAKFDEFLSSIATSKTIEVHIDPAKCFVMEALEDHEVCILEDEVQYIDNENS